MDANKNVVKVFSLHQSRWDEQVPILPLRLIEQRDGYAVIALITTGNLWLDRVNLATLEEMGL